MDKPDTLAPARLPLPVTAAPDPLEAAVVPDLLEPLAAAAPAAEPGRALRGRLLGRLAESQRAEAGKTVTRPRRRGAAELAPGVRVTQLYAHDGTSALRPGEPLRARLIELAPGARWAGPQGREHREWLVLRGTVRLGSVALGERDYHVAPAGSAAAELASDDGATVFLRESATAAAPGDAPQTVRDAEAGWPDFAPGVRRRVLWQRGREAALLYVAEPGAMVPHHTHGHDEECLMVQGELFLDDVLLQAGDYQLAPAGSDHRVTHTDTGVVIYAHGDADLQFVA